MQIQDKQQKPLIRKRYEEHFCFKNFKKYFNETTLHGLRFIGDDTITIWERLFFLVAVVCALVATTHLVSYIFAKWSNTPIIIGINPYPTYISDIPFPAITVCNMNQLSLSKVGHYSNTSYEKALMDIACFDNDFVNSTTIPDHYKNNNLSITDFLIKHSQSCSNLTVSCQLNSVSYSCSDLFHTSLTDEGMCCVFNILHPNFLYKTNNQIMTDNARSDGAVPVDWNPETGYPKELPDRYYPRPAAGIGVNMGLTIVLNALVNDYYCSSTNGPGFKFTLHSPVESARIKDNGLTVGVGEEIRFSVDPQTSTAVQNIRNLKWSDRNCLFSDEGNLTYYKYFTRRNCENECQAQYIYEQCLCIPYNLPMLYKNITVCGAPQYYCVSRADDVWLRMKDNPCRRKCMNSCFDLTYLATSFTERLAQDDYYIQNEEILRSYSKTYLKQNIAVVHFFFREFVFHGTVRNIYIGFTEFLSNIGGILSLFMGFSFISLAELCYFAFIRPVFWWILPRRQERVGNSSYSNSVSETPILLGNNQFKGNLKNAWQEPSSWERLNYRKFRGGKIKAPRELFNPSKKLQENH